jgi:hypothetical protein
VIFDTLATAISASLVDWLQKHGDRTNMEPSEFLANARIVAALMGVAGGELLIPTLVLLFGADIKLAGSLSLAVSLPTMIVGFARYSQDRSFTVLRPMAQADAWRMIRRRTLAAGVHAPISNHSFRATGITAYLANGGVLEHAQERRRMRAHERRNCSTGRKSD